DPCFRLLRAEEVTRAAVAARHPGAKALRARRTRPGSASAARDTARAQPCAAELNRAYGPLPSSWYAEMRDVSMRRDVKLSVTLQLWKSWVAVSIGQLFIGVHAYSECSVIVPVGVAPSSLKFPVMVALRTWVNWLLPMVWLDRSVPTKVPAVVVSIALE